MENVLLKKLHFNFNVFIFVEKLKINSYMNSKIIIPKKFKVGFNVRTDTYTGFLGYVIYHDGKKWRKENSWESWREKYITPEYEYEQKVKAFEEELNRLESTYNNCLKCKWDKGVYSGCLTNYEKYTLTTLEAFRNKVSIDTFRFNLSGKLSSNEGVKPVEYENEPLEGFVLNKPVGGVKRSWSSRNARQEKCRVYDPRGFEFEISIENLLWILDLTSSIKGKGLEGRFIYGWDRQELVLIPENAPEYEEMMTYTTLSQAKLSAKDIKEGHTYMDKDGRVYVYIGRRDVYLKEDLSPICSGRYNSDGYKRFFNPIKTYQFEDLRYRDRQHCYVELIDGFPKSVYSSSSVTNLFKSQISDSIIESYGDILKYALKQNFLKQPDQWLEVCKKGDIKYDQYHFIKRPYIGFSIFNPVKEGDSFMYEINEIDKTKEKRDRYYSRYYTSNDKLEKVNLVGVGLEKALKSFGKVYYIKNK